jgi:hypothetical protein
VRCPSRVGGHLQSSAMSRLLISLAGAPESVHGTPVAVELIDDTLEVINLGAVRIGERSTLEVEPGHYFVRARLPIGAGVQQSVGVDVDSTEVVLSLGDVISGPLPWHSLLGYITESVEVPTQVSIEAWDWWGSEWHNERSPFGRPEEVAKRDGTVPRLELAGTDARLRVISVTFEGLSL